jgi:hypothetical protein
MTNRFDFVLDPKELRWAAAEGVSEDVIVAVLLLPDRSADEIAPQLSLIELEQVLVLVRANRSPLALHTHARARAREIIRQSGAWKTSSWRIGDTEIDHLSGRCDGKRGRAR